MAAVGAAQSDDNDPSIGATVIVIVAPLIGLVVSCLCCACCLYYIGRSGLAAYLPRPLRACCVYEEEDDNDEDQKLDADFDVEAARTKLAERV